MAKAKSSKAQRRKKVLKNKILRAIKGLKGGLKSAEKAFKRKKASSLKAIKGLEKRLNALRK